MGKKTRSLRYGGIFFWREKEGCIEVLLTLRSRQRCRLFSEKWTTPGGGFNERTHYSAGYGRISYADRNFLDTARREAIEETSLPSDFFSRDEVLLDTEPLWSVRLPGYTAFVYPCEIRGGYSPFALDRRGENTAVRWFPLDSLPQRKEMIIWLPGQIRKFRRYLRKNASGNP